MIGKILLVVILFLLVAKAPVTAQNYSTGIIHDFPASGNYTDTTIYTTWLIAPANTSIYAAYQFGFEAGSVGYIGTQLYFSGEKKAVFSIWDADNNPQTAQPHETWCRRFDHEGLGSQCIIDYPWIVHREYKLEVRVRSSTPTSEIWEGNVVDTVTGARTLIGAHRLSNIRQYKGFGSIRNNISTFHEYFAQGTVPCGQQNYSAFQWRGPYVNNDSLLSTKAQIDYVDCTMANITSPSRGITISEKGQGSVMSNANGSILWQSLPPTPTPSPTLTPTSTPQPTQSQTPTPTRIPTGPSCSTLAGDTNKDGKISLVDYETWRRVFKSL